MDTSYATREFFREENPVREGKKLLPCEPGTILPAEDSIHKATGMRGVFEQCAQVTWGIFTGTNGVRITVARDELRFIGDRVDVFESIMASIEEIVPNEIVTTTPK